MGGRSLSIVDIERKGNGRKTLPTPEEKERVWESLLDNDFHIGRTCMELCMSKSTFWNWVRADPEMRDLHDRAVELRERIMLDAHREVIEEIALTGKNLEGEKASQQQTISLMFLMKHDAARAGDREYRDNAQQAQMGVLLSMPELQAIQQAYWDAQRDGRVIEGQVVGR